MILDCGETWDAKRKRLAEWHDFFPLFPRMVDVVNGRAVCAWLQTIERRKHYDPDPHPFPADWWEYRVKQSAPQNYSEAQPKEK